MMLTLLRVSTRRPVPKCARAWQRTDREARQFCRRHRRGGFVAKDRIISWHSFSSPCNCKNKVRQFAYRHCRSTVPFTLLFEESLGQTAGHCTLRASAGTQFNTARRRASGRRYLKQRSTIAARIIAAWLPLAALPPAPQKSLFGLVEVDEPQAPTETWDPFQRINLKPNIRLAAPESRPRRLAGLVDLLREPEAMLKCWIEIVIRT
jgi:hypothetical protein